MKILFGILKGIEYFRQCFVILMNSLRNMTYNAGGEKHYESS